MSTPLPNVAKALRVSVNGLINGTKPWRNAWHYGWSIGSSVTAAEILDVATAISGAWGTEVKHLVTPRIAMLETIVDALDSPTAPTSTVSSTQTGTGTGHDLAAGTAVVIQRHTARRYRGGHSRVYVPGPAAESLANDEVWDGGFVTDIGAAWANLEDAGAAVLIAAGRTDCKPSVIHYFHGFTNVLYPSGRYHVVPTLMETPTVDNVTEYGVNPHPCSQRRRESGR